MEINNLYNVIDREIDVALQDATGKELNFKTIYQLKDFLEAEQDFWKNFYDTLEDIDKEHVQSIKNSSLVLLSTSPKEKDIYSIVVAGLHFKTILNDFKIRLANTNPNNNQDIELTIDSMNRLTNSLNSKYWVYSQNTICKRGLEIFNEYGATVANSFFEAFLVELSFTDLSRLEGLKGAILAYEYQLQTDSELTNRITLEEESVLELQNSILNIRDSLYEDVLSSKNSFKKWRKETEKSIDDQRDTQEKEFDGHFETWSKKITSLEKTYDEKLRLSKPAEYWEKKAKIFKESGDLWAKRLTILVISGLGILVALLALWIYVQKDAIALGVESLQGVVLFITLLSIYAFAIKAVSKMTFSSYHLQRDAEEREQLTHLYLSLINEGAAFDTDSRSIVLQSLFSRVDSGLISGDSSPTMPGLPEIVQIATRRD